VNQFLDVKDVYKGLKTLQLWEDIGRVAKKRKSFKKLMLSLKKLKARRSKN